MALPQGLQAAAGISELDHSADTDKACRTVGTECASMSEKRFKKHTLATGISSNGKTAHGNVLAMAACHVPLDRHSGAVEALALSDERLCSGGLDGCINCWDVASDARFLGSLQLPSGILSLLSLDDGWLLAGLCDGSLRACRCCSRSGVHAVTTSASRHSAPVSDLAAVCITAGKARMVVVSGSDDASVRLWTMDVRSQDDLNEATANLKCTCRLSVPTSTAVTSVTFSHGNGSRVLLASSCSHGSANGAVKIWFLNEECTFAVAEGTLCEEPMWVDSILLSPSLADLSTTDSSQAQHLTLYCGWWNGRMEQCQLDFQGPLQCSIYLLLGLNMSSPILCMAEVTIPPSVMEEIRTKEFMGRLSVVVCGLSNGCIKVAMIGENGKWGHTLSLDSFGHEDAVSNLKVFNNKLFSTSWDGTVRIWSMTRVWDEVKVELYKQSCR